MYGSRKTRKERLDHTVQKLWEISLSLFQVYGYRPSRVGVAELEGNPVFEVILKHRDPQHRIRRDLETLVNFLDKEFRVIPFEARIDSKSKRLLLRKALVRPARNIPPMRSIIV